jgi:hypothetical protein
MEAENNLETLEMVYSSARLKKVTISAGSSTKEFHMLYGI